MLIGYRPSDTLWCSGVNADLNEEVDMRKALVLIAIGAIYRLVPHPVNMVPVGALSLYAGASLSRRWAWFIPVAAMAISDYIIDYATGRPLLDASRFIIYGAFASITLLGPLARRPKVGPLLLPALSLSASLIFFLASNFGAWLVPELNYPRSWSGLLTCYSIALPYFDRTLLADLLGTALLFGIDYAVARVKVAGLAGAPVLEPVHHRADS
jgi:hypothetical protein